MPAVVVHIYDTREVKVGGLGFQGQPYLYSKFAASLVYTRVEREKKKTVSTLWAASYLQ